MSADPSSAPVGEVDDNQREGRRGRAAGDDRLAAIGRGKLTSLYVNPSRYSDGWCLYTLFSGNPESVYLATLLSAVLPVAESPVANVPALVTDTPVPAIEAALPVAPMTQIQGLPVCISIADIKHLTGGKKREWQGLATPGSRYHYELSADRKARRGWRRCLAARPAHKQCHGPTGGFQAAA